MEFWAHINGNTYPVALGAVINDALGEELDSMDIRIPHVEDFPLKPYDDVYITDTEEYPERRAGELYPLGQTGLRNTFYRHFLVSNYQRQEINNEGFGRKRWFNFSISLISETKFLEKVLLPNRTITNPLNRTGKSVSWMANHFIKRYTPKFKTQGTYGRWVYQDKIRISSSHDIDRVGRDYLDSRMLSVVSEEFSDVECQECSFNNPTLREVLTRIFQTRNFIPVVLDGVVFCRSLDRKGDKLSEIEGKTWDTQTMDGNQYIDRLRKNYSQGLTGDNGCVFHEYVGFRNITSPTMTFQELAIEVSNPIYKINKFYICYFSQWNHNDIIKLDMTSFVIPNATRSFLSNDFMTYQKNPPSTVNGFYKNGDKNKYIPGLCDFRFNTVGYDIGSKRITGWGDEVKYTLDGRIYDKKTTLENIMNNALNTAESIGSKKHVILENGQMGYVTTYQPELLIYKTNDVVSPSVNDEEDPPNWLPIAKGIANLFGEENAIFGNETLKMKTIFFEIEYQGMVSSAVTVSKRLHDGDIMAIDNQQESMALTENDGLVSQIKANRLGNKTSVVNARLTYDQAPIKIGDYDDEHGICYKRTVSYERDFMAVTYYFCKDYVLTNYFTSVFSKYKSSAYASFMQSVERNETNDVQMLLSKRRRYNKATQYENPTSWSQYEDGFEFELDIRDALSVLNDTDDVSNDIAFFTLKAPKQGILEFDEYDESELEQQYFATDRALYLSGNSICMTMSMPDSETAGTYIKKLYPDIKKDSLNILKQWKDLQDTAGAGSENKKLRDVAEYFNMYAKNGSPYNDITGTLQDYFSLPTKRYDGSLSGVDFYFSFGNKSLKSLYNNPNGNTQAEIKNYYEADGTDGQMLGLLYQPKLLPSFSEKTIANNSVIFHRHEPYKDAKEIIGQTFQVEPIVEEDDDIIITTWMPKLSNIYNKTIQKITNHDKIIDADVLIAITDQGADIANQCVHSIGIYAPVNDFDLQSFSTLVGVDINQVIPLKWNGQSGYVKYDQKNVELTIHKITGIAPDKTYITVEVSLETGKFDCNIGPHSIVKMSKSHFEIKMWNDSFLSNAMIQRMNDPSINGNFYPSSALNISGWSYYNGIYCVKDGSTHIAESHLRSTPYRFCFSFNFDSFPNETTIIYYDSDDTDEIIETKVVSAEHYNPEILLENGGSMELTYPMSFAFCGSYDFYNDTSAFVGESSGPRQMTAFKIQQYQGDLIPQNIIWFYSKNAPTNIRKTYSSEEALNNDGFFLLDEAEDYLPTTNEAYKRFTYYGAIPIAGMVTSQIQDKYDEIQYVNCFYKDDNGEYHLVISIKKDEQEWPEYLDLGSEQIVVKASFYVSFLYDRSKTVYELSTMKPIYEIDNVAGETTTAATYHLKED